MTGDPDSFGLMARYNRWMNDRLYAVCRDIPDIDRRRDMGAFFGSVHATLDHIHHVDTVWLGRFTAQPENDATARARPADFAALQRARRLLDYRIVAWANTLQPDWLQRDLAYTSQIDGAVRRLPAWILVTHMFNHQTHHRGQATTLIKQLGYDPGVTDIPWLPELQATRID